MILCVTLNPCLDKTLTVPPWQPGDLVRGTAIREVVGGKGNNVARALRRLGQQARPVTFLGGPIGGLCESRLRADDGLDPIVIPTKAPTRVILTVRTGTSAEQTAFFDPDPAISPDEAEEMHRSVQAALQNGVDAADALGLEPLSDDPRAVQRPDLTGPGAADPGVPRHLRPVPQCDLGILADGDPAQPARGGGAHRASPASRMTMRPDCSRNGTGTA